MEATLEVYKRPYNPKYPVVCMDESSKQLVREVRSPISLQEGAPERYDTEYERNGVSNLFLFFEPLTGWRRVEVTNQRTALDWAQQIHRLVDFDYPEAERITLTMDNLNTHLGASLYKAFPPQEARRLLEKLEFQYTPKHGSWLNMAEIEFSILSRQCLNRRIPDQASLEKEVLAWTNERNQKATRVNWQFTTEEARIKLQRLYPSFND